MKPMGLQIASWVDGSGTHHTISAEDYRALLANRDTTAIAEFMKNNWFHNFLNPVGFRNPSSPIRENPGQIHMYHLCRLMIDIEIYRNGWIHREKSKGSIVASFIEFHPQFLPLKNYASGQAFYSRAETICFV